MTTSQREFIPMHMENTIFYPHQPGEPTLVGTPTLKCHSIKPIKRAFKAYNKTQRYFFQTD